MQSLTIAAGWFCVLALCSRFISTASDAVCKGGGNGDACLNGAEIHNFRRLLHAHPELSGHEKETQQRIKDALSEHGIDNFKEIGFGTLYSFNFGDGPHLLVRVDIDAVPIQETNDFPHRSTTDGVSHKCGHDGHTAIGVGLALKLHQEPFSNGSVTILFQPAEEVGEGARNILQDEAFDPKRFDHAVALHNIPGVPMHEVVWKYDSFTPAVQSVILRLAGRTTHAAHPHKGRNPTRAIAEIVLASAQMEIADERSPGFRLLTPVFTSVGSPDYGISPGFGEVHFTIRSWEQPTTEEATEALLRAAHGVAAAHGLQLESEIVAVFAANRNARAAVDLVLGAAAALNLKTQRRAEPFPWGEDFGLFTHSIPGAMVGLGAGEATPALHSADFDFPDELTATGVRLFYETARRACGSA